MQTDLRSGSERAPLWAEQRQHPGAAQQPGCSTGRRQVPREYPVGCPHPPGRADTSFLLFPQLYPGVKLLLTACRHRGFMQSSCHTLLLKQSFSVFNIC